jgi:hypothetical protein
MLTGSTGVKDLDVVLFFAAIPGERLPEFPRLVKHLDFGPSSLGRQEYDLAAARDARQRRQWARWAAQHQGRRVDLVKRALAVSLTADPAEAIQSWLLDGMTGRHTASAYHLSRKPVVFLSPADRRGEFAWRGVGVEGPRGTAFRLLSRTSTMVSRGAHARPAGQVGRRAHADRCEQAGAGGQAGDRVGGPNGAVSRRPP